MKPPPTAAATLSPRPQRPRLVTFLAWLLLAQAGALLVGSVVYLLPARSGFAQIVDNWRLLRFGAFIESVGLVVTAALAVWAAFGFFRLRATAWLVATSVQTLTFGIALVLYARHHLLSALVMMAYGIGMVLYLFQGDVRAAFHPRMMARDPLSR